MSQGGFIALRAALTHPDRIKGLVLIDSQAGVDDDATPMARAEALASLLSGCEALIRVEGAPHASNLTHAAGVNPALRDFVLKHG
jgi:pimeloyl-ACP methyl ester carboxylesterase